ncbi:MAG: 23S rRNA (uracil(1939)-C(5))-methyltransferase RlmD [Oscillospiraceae bacterium]|nr:23S rRNA (uracil(1939)-C(5))-methyltransferase RlmD [Oscillospiraceae bacterium]
MEKVCPLHKKCGGCQMMHLPYAEQLRRKENQVRALLGRYGKVSPILGMENPYHYRNKVQAAFKRLPDGRILSGVYQSGSHRVVPVDDCLLEDRTADAIIVTVRSMLKSFKIPVFDEDTGRGVLRHVLVKRGFHSGEVMVVLVCATPTFPSRNNFVKALLDKHPEITTVILNINPYQTNLVLGPGERVLYGKGTIEDTLCGKVFRISAKSFYQINPVQTEILYGKAMELADLHGTETVIDAYCGIGTIGLVASDRAGKVIGVELNKDAVHDAIANCKRNGVKNARFYCGDAGEFMRDMAHAGEKADVVFMDPPRAGSSREFLLSAVKLAPKKIVYISCNPETQARDIALLHQNGYRVQAIQPVDMFPHTAHVETIVLLSRA